MKRFGPYDVTRKLGEGGMAEVWLGERSGPGGFSQRVALKRIHPRYGRDEILLSRFVTEARTNARLAHSNIVKVLDFGTEPEPYMALEYVESVSLGQFMQRMYGLRQRIDVSAAMFVAVGVAQALDYAHKLRDDDGTPLGIVHRDVSPANLLLSADGTPYVMDFGLVQVADNFLETWGAAPVGTFCYMAPEQLAGGHVDARADLWSLGVVLWELLTTRQLVTTNDPDEVKALQQTAKFRKPSELNPDVPSDLDELTMQCLRLDPDERPPSAEGVSVPLQRMLHERAPGYGREQLAKTLKWAFPERNWAREPGHEPAVQPEPEDRARLARQKHAARPRRGGDDKRGFTALAILAIGGLMLVTAIAGFIAGVLWTTW